jgi:hypothetical protein
MVRFDIHPVMAFGFAEVTTVDQVLNRIPVPATA